MYKLIPLYATKTEVNILNNYVSYTTDVELDSAIILVDDTTGKYDMSLCNQVHKGGVVKLIFKPIKIPARKFEVGDKIGEALVFTK